MLGAYLLLWKTFDCGLKKKLKQFFFWVSIPHINGTRNLIVTLLLQKKIMALVLVLVLKKLKLIPIFKSSFR
jgi:hypothetical protein